MHKRKEIKTNLKTILDAGLPSGKYTVYKSRYLPIDHDRELPAICMYIPDENTTKIASNEGYDRVANTVIVIYISGKDITEIISGEQDVDELMDEYSKDVETVLLTPYQTLSNLIYDMNLTSTRYMVDSEGDEIIGMVIMGFDSIYKDDIT